MKHPIHILSVLLAVVIVVLGIQTYADHVRVRETSMKISTLENSIASSSIEFKEHIGALAEKLSSQEEKNTVLTNELIRTQENLNKVEGKFGKVSNTVEELEKLTKADPKLLQKYSKVFFLNEHYEPERLTEIPKEYTLSTIRTESINARVWPHLKEMLEDAAEDDISLLIVSSYRSFNTQAALKNQYTVTYGAGTASQFSADQGYSEHQLGTTIDISTPKLGSGYTAFESTEAYQWLQKNAYKYGFILSYPKDNQYYIFEPWHWRFVGKELAEYLHDNEKNFYDLEQRKIDEFLPNMFD